MTIQALYSFASSNNLLNKDIGEVIDKYINHISSSTLDYKKEDCQIIDYKNKIEFSTEDILQLFTS